MNTYIGEESGSYVIDFFDKEEMSKFVYVATATSKNDHHSCEWNVSMDVGDHYTKDVFKSVQRCTLQSRPIVEFSLVKNGNVIELHSLQHLDRRVTYHFKKISLD